MTTRRRIERLEARVNVPPADTFREHWWRGVALASQDTEPGPAPEEADWPPGWGRPVGA